MCWITGGHATRPPIERNYPNWHWILTVPKLCLCCSWTIDASGQTRHFIARKLHFRKFYLKTEPSNFCSTHATMQKPLRLRLCFTLNNNSVTNFINFYLEVSLLFIQFDEFRSFDSSGLNSIAPRKIVFYLLQFQTKHMEPSKEIQ